MLQKSSLKLPVELTPRSPGCPAWQIARKNCTTFHFQVPRGDAGRQSWNFSTGTEQPTKAGQMSVDTSEQVGSQLSEKWFWILQKSKDLDIWTSWGLYPVRCSGCSGLTSVRWSVGHSIMSVLILRNHGPHSGFGWTITLSHESYWENGIF